MAKRKALGSGLEALLSTKQPAAGSQNQKEDYLVPSSSKISSIPIHEISRNKNQPRQVFFNNALESIASSIKKIGQKVPILVRKKDDGYELIAGERRWRAMQSIQAENIDAIVMDVTDKESALIAIVENVQREQLNPIEEAEALLKLNTQYDMTHDDIDKPLKKYMNFQNNFEDNASNIKDLIEDETEIMIINETKKIES